ncbi:MAG: caspase family protein, partial [Hyphomicrobiaceae bacterium]
MADLQRIALIIGNGAYTNSKPLDNPVNDAALITARLISLGYKIVGGATSPRNNTGRKEGMNLTSLQMGVLIGQFASQITSGATAVIYYAGHGLQVGGNNYLVPIDDSLDVKLDKLGLIDIKPRVETIAVRVGQNGAVVVFLDACRDNPMSKDQQRKLLDLLEPVEREAEFGQESTTSSPTRGGLSSFKMAHDPNCGRTFIGFATAPGDFAYDGPKGSQNSPFATALDTQLAIRGLGIEPLYDRVQCDVQDAVAAMGQHQDPWSETNLDRELYLYPRSPVPVFAMAAAGLAVGLVVCSQIFQGGNIVKQPPVWMWFLGGLLGLVSAWGTLQWGSRRWEHALFAFAGPVFGFAVSLAVLKMIPSFDAGIKLDEPSPDRELASYVFGLATLIGMGVYFVGIVMVRYSQNIPWPRTFFGWLNRVMVWVLPVAIAGTLICLDALLRYANPLVTAITLCALLAGILYATSAELGCRPQLGLFKQFGAFTGAISVGLLMAVLFAVFAWIHFKVYNRTLHTDTLQLIMIGFGSFWHMLLGAQLGYCFAYYVPDHQRKG